MLTKRRSFAASASALGVALLIPLLGATPAHADDPDFSSIRINEVESDPNDLIELVNTSDEAVDISGLVLKDNDDTHSFTIPAETTLAAHGFASFDVDPSFGLGKGDSARLFLADGVTELDSTTWPAGTHASTWGRCPDGRGEFVVLESRTLGSANACPEPDPTDITINEVKTNPNPDFVELYNSGSSYIDIQGWKVADA